jgi:hypothetical protein
MATLDSLIGLQQMDPVYRDALFSQMGLAKTAQAGMGDLMSQLSQDALAAQGGLLSAESKYAGALQQPPPTEGPGEVTSSFFGNLATGLTGQPRYSEQAEAGNTRDLNALMEQRKEQLASLHENVTKRAALAQQLGNLKLSTSLQQQASQVERALDGIDKIQEGRLKMESDKLLQGQKDAAEMERLRLRLKSEEEQARIRAGQAASAEMDAATVAWATKINSGQASINQVPAKSRNKVVLFMEQAGMSITDPRVRAAKAGLGGTERAIKTMETTLSKIPGGYGFFGRMGAGLKAKGAAIAQPKGYKEPAVYEAQREFFKTAVSKLSGQVGVLTEKDVQSAMKMLPSAADNPEVRTEKFQELRDFIQSRYQAWLEAFSTPEAGIGSSMREKYNY